MDNLNNSVNNLNNYLRLNDMKKNAIINFVFTYIKKIDLVNVIEEFESDFSSDEELCDSDFEYD